MRTSTLLGVALLAHVGLVLVDTESLEEQRHHRHHRGDHHKKHHHKKNHSASDATVASSKSLAVNASGKAGALPAVAGVVGLHVTKAASNASSNASATSTSQVLTKMKALEQQLNDKQAEEARHIQRGKLNINGPLPAGFADTFGQAVATATGCNAAEVNIIDTQYADPHHKLATIYFEAPLSVVHTVEDEATDPYSKLSNGVLRPFLVAQSSYVVQAPYANPSVVSLAASGGGSGIVSLAVNDNAAADESAAGEGAPPAEPCQHDIDIDTEMPYGELEPFGREDTAQELTESSITESDEMVDQLERAEVAEEKRAVFRALTRLRGAAITSFDGVARSQTGNIDEYNKVHKWRMTHPLRHLADEESDISKWAFPDNADF